MYHKILYTLINNQSKVKEKGSKNSIPRTADFLIFHGRVTGDLVLAAEGVEAGR